MSAHFFKSRDGLQVRGVLPAATAPCQWLNRLRIESLTEHFSGGLTTSAYRAVFKSAFRMEQLLLSFEKIDIFQQVGQVRFLFWFAQYDASLAELARMLHSNHRGRKISL